MNQGALIAAVAADNRMPVEAVAAYVENIGVDDPDTLGEAISDAYAGEHDSLADYAYEVAENIGAIPDASEWPLMHIDWKAAGRDLELGGDVWMEDAPNGGVYVFHNY